jgi:hypothetical protein
MKQLGKDYKILLLLNSVPSLTRSWRLCEIVALEQHYTGVIQRQALKVCNDTFLKHIHIVKGC